MSKAFSIWTVILMTLSVGTASAQEKPVTSFEVDVPQGAALFRSDIQAGYMPAVWCGPRVAAFPGGEYRRPGVRRSIRYYDLQLKTSVEEILDDQEGAMVACSADGSQRLTVFWETDAMERGTFSLVSAGGKPTIKLLDGSYFVSSDKQLRTFVFATQAASSPYWNWAGNLELVTVNGSADSAGVNRSKKFGDAVPVSVSLAAVSADGKVIVYSHQTTADRARWDDPSAVDVVVSAIDQGASVHLAMDRVLKGADKVKALSFDQDKVMIVGVSDDKKLVVATCPTKVRSPRECQSVLTELDADKFAVLGLGETGFIFGNQEYFKGSRVCIFETPEGKLRDVPPTCTMEAPSAPVYGQYAPEAFYVLSPDRRHVAVLSKYRAPAGEPMSTVSEWAIVPMSAYRVR